MKKAVCRDHYVPESVISRAEHAELSLRPYCLGTMFQLDTIEGITSFITVIMAEVCAPQHVHMSPHSKYPICRRQIENRAHKKVRRASKYVFLRVHPPCK